jgi:2-polyprenyl-6-methoxyphenol hydroxylase-like FAD-dependent oxidoreductase
VDRPDILASLRRADSVYFDKVSQIRMGSWSRGRTVLLGDAAWCVTLFAGSGAALAVAGTELLGTHLDRQSDVPAALRS